MAQIEKGDYFRKFLERQKMIRAVDWATDKADERERKGKNRTDPYMPLVLKVYLIVNILELKD